MSDLLTFLRTGGLGIVQGEEGTRRNTQGHVRVTCDPLFQIVRRGGAAMMNRKYQSILKLPSYRKHWTSSGTANRLKANMLELKKCNHLVIRKAPALRHIHLHTAPPPHGISHIFWHALFHRNDSHTKSFSRSLAPWPLSPNLCPVLMHNVS